MSTMNRIQLGSLIIALICIAIGNAPRLEYDPRLQQVFISIGFFLLGLDCGLGLARRFLVSS